MSCLSSQSMRNFQCSYAGVGVHTLNAELQAKLNPAAGPKVTRTTIRVYRRRV